MSIRVPIFGDKRLKRWRANFIAAPFEVKLLPLIFNILALLPFASFFTENNTAQIIHYATLPGGGIFFIQAGIQSFRLVLGDQSIVKQIQNRLFIIVSLLLIVVLDRFDYPSYFLLHSPAYVIRQVHFYKPIYKQIIPLAFTVILLIRLAPLTFKYYKLKKEQKRLTPSRAN